MIIVLSFIFQFNISKAQISEGSFSFDRTFPFTEFSESVDYDLNVDHLNISIPSPNWNITDMEVNFTQIKLDKEVVTIEEGGESFKVLNKGTKAWGVQLNITEEILLFGVFVYINLNFEEDVPVYVQINGYDTITDTPNATVYGEPIPINVTAGSFRWYRQNFPEPISLPIGNYYLVLNGSAYQTNDNSDYWWLLNDNSNNTELRNSKFDGSTWSVDDIGKPFNHKLIRRINKLYNPEDINMTIAVDQQEYPIFNGIIPNTGKFNLTNTNLSTNSSFYNFPINHNQTVDLIFNTSYVINYKSIQHQQSSVLIKNGEDNIWSINFTLFRIGNNFSVNFNYPTNWHNLLILRDGVNVTSQLTIDTLGHLIHIPNSTILNTDNWEIRANSFLEEFTLNIPPREYQPGQEIRFSVDSPVGGNYTLVLYNADHFEIDEAHQTLSYPTDEIIFSYILPSYSVGGEYHAYIYFFNGIDAGVESASFTLIIPFTIDPFLVLIISLASVILIGISGSLVYAVRNHKKKVEAYKQEIYDKCMDILNLNYIMVSETTSFLNVYEQVFTKQYIDPTLISGFLSAIRAFGIELTNSEEQTQTIKLEYKDSKIIMAEFRNFRIVLIMKLSPSPKFLEAIKSLAFDIEQNYSKYLENFKGNVGPFGGIESLLKKHLDLSFIYPLNIVEDKKTKINPTERLMIERARDSMKKSTQKYFYTNNIMEQQACDSKEIEAIFSLIHKGIFKPIM